MQNLGYSEPVWITVFNNEATAELKVGEPVIWDAATVHASNLQKSPQILASTDNSNLVAGVLLNDIPAKKYGPMAVFGLVKTVVTSATSPAINEPITCGARKGRTSAGAEVVFGRSMAAGAADFTGGSFYALCLINTILMAATDAVIFGKGN